MNRKLGYNKFCNDSLINHSVKYSQLKPEGNMRGEGTKAQKMERCASVILKKI